jgi:hypothetical protein
MTVHRAVSPCGERQALSGHLRTDLEFQWIVLFV